MLLKFCIHLLKLIVDIFSKILHNPVTLSLKKIFQLDKDRQLRRKKKSPGKGAYKFRSQLMNA